MPGRQSHGPAPIRKKKESKSKGKRSQNALAIAEQQDPEHVKIRQHRLGQSDSEPSKRKREHVDDDLNREGDGAGKAKRRRPGEKDRYGNEIEWGSDSSDNEWTVGQVDGENDSDIDSDEAMADSDDEGIAIKGSKANLSRAKPNPRTMDVFSDDDEAHDIDLREDVNEANASDDDNNSFGDAAVDLAAMLDESDDGEGLPRKSETLGESGREGLDEDTNEANGNPKFASEDESSIFSYSGDEDDEKDAAKLASLQTLVATINKQDQGSGRARGPVDDAQESMTPSEFGLNSKRKLTVADLASSVTDPKLRKSLKLLADSDSKSKRGSIPKKLDVPLPRRQQDRLDRAAAYEKSKETLNRWIDTVKHNRRAEHLSFPLKDPNAAAAQGSTRLLPTAQTKPLTELESTIHSILQDSGLANSDGKSGEDRLQAFEDLKTKKMPLEEVQARRAELRKARELLFREEVRAKRIKKIKSKTYRKVHRRERERNAQQERDALMAAGVDDSESERERKDRRRAEERMGARHRESKWAKGVKESGKAKWDEDARGGVTEMAKRGEELKRRIEGKAVVMDEDQLVTSESEEEDDEFEDGMDGGKVETSKIHDRLRRLNENDNELESKAKGSRLASMDFMKNAENARRARNEADLESLRRDMAGEETPDEEDDQEGPGRRIFGPAKDKSSTRVAPPAQPKNEFEERQDSGDESADEPSGKAEEDELEIIVDAANADRSSSAMKKPSISDKRRKKGLESKNDLTPETTENPWLIPSKKVSKADKIQARNSNVGAIISNSLPTEVSTTPAPNHTPQPALKATKTSKKAQKPAEESSPKQPTAPNVAEDEDSDTEPLPFVLRNQDLVRKAFADDSVVASFTAEKNAATTSEAPQTIDTTLPGWGSWTGPGLSKKAQRRNKGKTFTTQPGIPQEKRQDAKLDRVIINEKRVKKNGKYLASSLPHPFETRRQYQRSLRMPVGPEWATKLAFQDATKPRVLMKQGIVRPMAKPMV